MPPLGNLDNPRPNLMSETIPITINIGNRIASTCCSPYRLIISKTEPPLKKATKNIPTRFIDRPKRKPSARKSKIFKAFSVVSFLILSSPTHYCVILKYVMYGITSLPNIQSSPLSVTLALKAAVSSGLPSTVIVRCVVLAETIMSW